MSKRNIRYIKGNLFDVSPPAILAHACNTSASWGGGIARQFGQLFPEAEESYMDHCFRHSSEELLGTAFLVASHGYLIACLFTSVHGGEDPDSIEDITNNTRLAVQDMERQLSNTVEDLILRYKEVTRSWVIDMPMINSGLFRCPWELTEAVLNESELSFNVYVI